MHHAWLGVKGGGAGPCISRSGSFFDGQHSPAAEPVVTLGEARGWGPSSVSSEVVMHRVSALGASQGVF